MKIFVIADCCCNHQGSLSTAEDMITAAKDKGADAVKFQLYRTNEILAYEDQQIQLGKTSKYTDVIYDGIAKTEFTVGQMKHLKEFCDEAGIEYMCTPFIKPYHVDELEAIGVQRYKIRERDAQNKDLIDRVLATGKPIYISTVKLPADPLYLFHPQIKWIYCIPKYPPEPQEMSLSRLDAYDGFSCHYPTITPAVSACATAKYLEKSFFVIEKHFMLEDWFASHVIDRDVSIDPRELKELVTHVRRIEQFG